MVRWLVLALLAGSAAGCSARSPSVSGSSSDAAPWTEGCLGGCLCWTTPAACAANACEWTESVATTYPADGAAVDGGLQGGCIPPPSGDAAPAGGW